MFAGHISLQLAHLCMEHQVNRFMGCDYNIEGVWRVLKDAIGAGRGFADLHQLHQRTRQVLMAHQERPIWTRVRIQTETYGLAITLDSARC